MESVPLVILLAFVLDLLFGDPRWLPHPVRLIGRLIPAAELFLRRSAHDPAAERRAGLLLAAFIVLSVVSFSCGLLFLAARLSASLAFAVSVALAYTTLAGRSLGDAAHAVRSRLEAGDIVGARKSVAMIVGRDTESLDEQGIVRASVESVAENASDGVIAPLFYLALGGPAFAMAYKAVNTLDSLVGYKNARYLHFGRASARLDDVANYVPARITAILICLSSALLRRLGPAEAAVLNSARDAWRVVMRDGRNHPSPNSGVPEAAMAGALNVMLGGPSTYAGTICQKPYIGDGAVGLDKKHIAMSVRFLYCSFLLGSLAAAGAAAGLSFCLTKILAVL
jgi:adenosylcobinamide-phosphate synthase